MNHGCPYRIITLSRHAARYPDNFLESKLLFSELQNWVVYAQTATVILGSDRGSRHKSCAAALPLQPWLSIDWLPCAHIRTPGLALLPAIRNSQRSRNQASFPGYPNPNPNSA